jgi:hypothetical protein
MIQHLIITSNGQRKTIVLEYTSQEYGVSEQSFWSCWLADEKHINADGDSAEACIKDMIEQMEYRKEMWRISAEMRKNLQESFGIRCPVVADDL